MAKREPAPSAEADQICLACGLCCSGAMFGYVGVEEAQMPAMRALGLTPCSNVSGFSQPCTAHGAEGCRIYALRPAPCRDYRCELLRAAQSGAVTVDKARSLIAQALALQTAQRAEGAQGILAKGALQRLLDKHFLSESKRLLRKPIDQ
jgi:Uncharacterised protein family (UPF0153).